VAPSFDELVEKAPKMNCSADEYIDSLALWLKSEVGVYTPDLLIALIKELSKRDRRLRYVTPKKVMHRLHVLERRGLLRLRYV